MYRAYNGRTIMSKKAREYKKTVQSELYDITPKPYYEKDPILMRIACYEPDHRKRDISNLIKCLEDACEGIIYNNDYQVNDINIFRAGVDKKNPRVELHFEADILLSRSNR